MRSPGNRPLLRLGELGQRLGVSDHVLLFAALRQALDAFGEPARLIAGDPVTEAERAGWSR